MVKRDKVMKKMYNQIKEFEQEKIIHFETQEKLDKLYQYGVIDSAWNYILHFIDKEKKDMD